jgi:hypothetical protein
MTQQLQSFKAARTRSRSSYWGYGCTVGSRLDGSLAGLEIWIAGGDIGAAAAPPVERPPWPHVFLGCSVGRRCRSATLKERTLVVSLLILMSPLLILASAYGQSSHSIKPNPQLVG